MNKLHLGCGPKVFPGWINCDIAPAEKIPADLRQYYRRLDLSAPLPFENDSADLIYSEDFIEHFEQSLVMLMLVEQHRVLKPEGTVRISTPSLAYWMAPEKMRERGGGIVSYHDFFKLVQTHWLQFRHKLLFTPQFLKETLEMVGFRDVIFVDCGKSAHPELRGIDTRLEQAASNIIIEARK
ncbi:MAG: methyltransferase domain-containing protein [Candidatus Margulisiibacteriota bacterium]